MDSSKISSVASGTFQRAPAGNGNIPDTGKVSDTFTPGTSVAGQTIDAKKVADALLSGPIALTPEVLWEFDLGGAVQSKPFIGDDGTIFTGTRDGNVYALDPKTGDKKWKFKMGDGFYSDITAGSEDLIYVPGGEDKMLHALDRKTGEQKWEFDLDGVPSRSAETGPDGTLFIGSSVFKPVGSVASACDHGMVYALDGKTGGKKWEFRTPNLVVSAPAPGPEGSVYFGGYDGKFYSIDEKTGAKKWEFETEGWISSTPAFSSDGKAYFGSWDKKLYALDCKTGEKLWEFETGGDLRGNPLIGPDGTVYVGSFDGNLYAIDGENGGKKWCRNTGDKVLGSPVMDKNGVVYVGNYDGKVYAFEGDTGGKKWEFQADGLIHGAPSIGPDGIVYIGSNKGKLYALDSTKLEKLVDKLNEGNPGGARGENGSSVEIFDDFVIINGVKLPRKKE